MSEGKLRVNNQIKIIIFCYMYKEEENKNVKVYYWKTKLFYSKAKKKFLNINRIVTKVQIVIVELSLIHSEEILLMDIHCTFSLCVILGKVDN